MSRLLRVLTAVFSFIAGTGLVLGAIGGFVAIYFFLVEVPELPATQDLHKIKLDMPLKVYSIEGKLIEEFGEIRRVLLKYEDMPKDFRNAFISAEDDRFHSHVGFDYQGLMRAAYNNGKSALKKMFKVRDPAEKEARPEGGSTITMQLARNLFLTADRTMKRKRLEIFLAMKMEREMSKEKILELYLNRIYLGNRAHGIQAAAQVYYGKPVSELTIGQMAMIAGLPKGPSIYNPAVNAPRAKARRDYVLDRMFYLKHIDKSQYENAKNEPFGSTLYSLTPAVDAPNVAEAVRKEMTDRYGDKKAYEEGYSVYTTIRAEHQKAAVKALRTALLEYDRRHGYRGPMANKKIDAKLTETERIKLLNDYKEIGGLVPALVLSIDDKSAQVYTQNGIEVNLVWDDIKWAKKYIDEDHTGPEIKKVADALAVGDVIYVEHKEGEHWLLAQEPIVEGAIVALDPKDGAVTALVGGFDFNKNKFNRVTQAKRQPGSSFKPFIYSAAIDKQFTPASLFNDTHVVLDSKELDEAWRPENAERQVFGPTRMREAITKSRNLVAIRILKTIGVDYAIEYAQRFGFTKEQLVQSRNLTLALGSVSVTPLQIASGYTVFANGGFLVSPYFIQRIEKDGAGTVFTAEPVVACPECEANPQQHKTVKAASRVISAQTSYQMVSMMRDVVRAGTATRAYKELKRNDLAGKTGTTNDQQDAWFSGFSPDLVAAAWVGFDKVKSLGKKEFGGAAALPMWIGLMRVALKDKPERFPKMPPGMVTVKIDSKSGRLAQPNDRSAIDEIFPEKLVPKEYADVMETSPFDGGEKTDSSKSPGTGNKPLGRAPEDNPLF